MMEFKYIYKLSEAIKAKKQGGFLNRIYVLLVRYKLRKRLKKLSKENVSKEYFDALEIEINKL